VVGAWLSPKVQGKRDARSCPDAGGVGKLLENKRFGAFLEVFDGAEVREAA
jgi:hypothetical protein